MLTRSRRVLTWGALAAWLFVLTPAMAPAAGIQADTGLLSPPIVDQKPVKVKVGLFLTNLIEVDEVKETFDISGYLFMTWKPSVGLQSCRERHGSIVQPR